MTELSIQTHTKDESGDIASLIKLQTTNESEEFFESLTSNAGYSNVYSSIYSGPSSFALEASYALITPSETNTQPIYVSVTSTEWGVRLSSRGPSLMPITGTLYLATTGSTSVEVTVRSF